MLQLNKIEYRHFLTNIFFCDYGEEMCVGAFVVRDCGLGQISLINSGYKNSG